MCFSTTKEQRQRTDIRKNGDLSAMALPGIMSAWPSFGGQGTSPHLQSAHQLSVCTALVHTSSPVQQADSPAEGQSPETPAKPVPVLEETTPVATNVTGFPMVNGTALSFPSSNISGKKPKRTRRKRCLECEGCRRKDNCGVCSVCTNKNATNTVCKKRRCEMLKTRPIAAVSPSP